MRKELIEQLDLIRHEEGGYYRRTYTSSFQIKFDGKDRAIGSAIYYYLDSQDFSAWHRIKSDEMWHFYSGSELVIHMIAQDRRLLSVRLGDPQKDNHVVPQFTVSAGIWFAAEVGGVNSYALVGCTCFPEFDYADFEIADRDELVRQFPEHKDIIYRLSRK